MSTEIDLFKYGQLVAQVDQLSTKVDKLEEGMEELLALANKSKGGLWAGMIVVSAISSLIGFLSHYFSIK